MNVGDYVRYVDVFNNTIKIRKINKVIPPDKLIKKDVYFFNNKECSLKENIIKSSPNIIDLIEARDYVNGYKITTIGSNGIYAEDENGYLIKMFTKEDIKSIVTKEQFESCMYKVGK